MALERSVGGTRDAQPSRLRPRGMGRRRSRLRMAREGAERGDGRGRATRGGTPRRRARHRLRPAVASSTSGGSGRAAPSVHVRAMWRGHVALFVAAARPAGHVSVAANVPPSPVKKMLFADDDDDDDDDDSVGDPNAWRARGLETQVGLGDVIAIRLRGGASMGVVAVRRRRRGRRAGIILARGGVVARLRSDAMIDALSASRRRVFPSIVSVVAASVAAASAVASEAKNAPKASWPALAPAPPRGSRSFVTWRPAWCRARPQSRPRTPPFDSRFPRATRGSLPPPARRDEGTRPSTATTAS